MKNIKLIIYFFALTIGLQSIAHSEATTTVYSQAYMEQKVGALEISIAGLVGCGYGLKDKKYIEKADEIEKKLIALLAATGYYQTEFLDYYYMSIGVVLAIENYGSANSANANEKHCSKTKLQLAEFDSKTLTENLKDFPSAAPIEYEPTMSCPKPAAKYWASLKERVEPQKSLICLKKILLSKN